MNRKNRIAIGVLIVTLIVLAGTAWGQDIRARMRARLPAIVAMKAAGAVGENNQGYLVIRNPSGAKKDIVEAENQDRRMIYQAIAKKHNTTPDLVGQRRALHIAEKAEPGTWIQGAGGKWRQK